MINFVMMKQIAAILFFLAISINATSQFYYGGLAYTYPQTKLLVDSSGNVRFQQGDIGFTMQAGAFAGSNFNGRSWFGTSVSPAIAYNVSPRLRLKAGVSITQGFGDNYFYSTDSHYSPINTNTTTTSVFVQGDYLLSNKVMISGAAYKYFSPYNFNIDDPRLKGPDGEGFLFNINYRPTGNFEINASFEYGNGNYQYRPGHFYRPSPFSNDPFLRW